jgi:hypothetical protein
VQPVERYLAYLTDIERSPNTVKAYAHDLKDWFVFLARQGLDWQRSGWKMSPGSSPGCGGLRPRAMGRWRCCRRWSITAGNRRSTASCRR